MPVDECARGRQEGMTPVPLWSQPVKAGEEEWTGVTSLRYVALIAGALVVLSALTDGTGTVADFAYPDERLLIYIDGMSEKIHGNPAQQTKDVILRAKLRSGGYQVVEITAVSLNDRTAIAAKLSEIAVYLGRDDLFEP